MFKSLIHFEFTLVRWGSDFILVHVVVQFLKHHLTENTVFCPLYSLASFVID